METRFLLLPVDARAEAHEEAWELRHGGRVALCEEGEADQVAFGGDVEGVVLEEHFPPADELLRDDLGDLFPFDIGVGVLGAFGLDADAYQVRDGERGVEAYGAEVAEVGEAKLIEVLVSD